MPDVTSTDENDWGPEQTEVPPVGSIFLIRLEPSYVAVGAITDRKYKLIKYDPNADPNNNLELEHWTGSRWAVGHSWGTHHKPTFRLLKVAHTSGCICKKCNASNPWAVPNRPNGEYLCYECR